MWYLYSIELSYFGWCLIELCCNMLKYFVLYDASLFLLRFIRLYNQHSSAAILFFITKDCQSEVFNNESSTQHKVNKRKINQLTGSLKTNKLHLIRQKIVKVNNIKVKRKFTINTKLNNTKLQKYTNIKQKH